MSKRYPPASQIIATSAPLADKIYIREQQGYYQRIRRALGWLLMLLFIGIPWLNWNGQQAFRIDVAQQHVTLLDWRLFPQDLMIVALLFMFGAFALFYVTQRYGRIWCGFTCPQTIWTLMYVWVERRIEGSHHKSQQLDKQHLSAEKVVKRAVKHAIWLLLALFTALAFMAYFIPARSLYVDFLSGNSSTLISAWVLFFMCCTYINAALIREKMCLHMCPYARFQSAMYADNTKLVSYDQTRGEQRGPRKRQAQQPEALGDCVDCKLCVQVCPVGIDIRDGLQYECINCGLCVDACNETMDKFAYQRDLIGYRPQTNGSSASRWRQWGYAAVMLVIVGAMGIWGWQRQSVEVNVLGDRNQLFQYAADGAPLNAYTLKLLNKNSSDHRYKLSIIEPYANIIDAHPLQLKAAQQHQQVVTVALTKTAPVSKDLQQPEILPLTLLMEDLDTGEKIQRKLRFIYAG